MKTIIKFAAAALAAAFCAAGSALVAALCAHDLVVGRFHGLEAFAAGACSVAFAGLGAFAAWGYARIAHHVFTTETF